MLIVTGRLMHEQQLRRVPQPINEGSKRLI